MLEESQRLTGVNPLHSIPTQLHERFLSFLRASLRGVQRYASNGCEIFPQIGLLLGRQPQLNSPANRNISNLLGPNSLEFDEFDPWRMVSPVQLILVIPTCEVN